LPVRDGMRPILEQSDLPGKGHDPFSRSVPAGERRRRVESRPCTVITHEPPQ
jgi:hypothetical protein